MSKYYLFLLVLFAICSFSGLKAQEEEEPLITEIQLTKGDSTYRHLYLYNESNTKSLETKYVQMYGNWIRREQTEWFYINGLCTEQHVRIWKNNDWRPLRLIEFQYADNYLESETLYNTQNGGKVNLLKTVFTYADGKKSSKTDYSWINEAWRMDYQLDFTYNTDLLPDTIFQNEYANHILTSRSKTFFTYNDSLNVKTSTTSVKSDDGWINSSLSLSYYKPSTKLLSSEILKKWDSKYNIWTNVQNVEYLYDASGKLTEENYQYWNIAFWVNDLRYGYQYDSDGILLKKTTFLAIYNDFRPAWSINYSEFQDSKARLIEAKNEFWGGETEALFNTFIPYQFNDETVINQGSRVQISYIPVRNTGINSTFGNNEINLIQVYPNPSKAIFYFNVEKYSVEKWHVTDLSGKLLISKEQKERSGVIDLGDFKPGIYLLQVFTPDGIKTQKLIKK